MNAEGLKLIGSFKTLNSTYALLQTGDALYALHTNRLRLERVTGWFQQSVSLKEQKLLQPFDVLQPELYAWGLWVALWGDGGQSSDIMRIELLTP